MIQRLLMILLASFFIVGCGTTKGYIGEKLPDTELAIISGGLNNVIISKKKYTEQVLIAKVDSLEVGNYFKGWPKKMKVKPGEHIVEVRHIRPWNRSNIYYGGGAIGGAIAGASIEKNMTHYHYLIKFEFEKNQSYLVKIKSNPENLTDYPLIEILNTVTNEIVEHKSEEVIINQQ